MTSAADYWRMFKARGLNRVVGHFTDVTLFDLIHGTDTDTWLPLAAYDAPDLDLRQAVQYQPSFSSEIDRSLKRVSARLGARLAEFEFFDLGSGKGKVCLLARAYGFRAIHGIEFYRPLVDIAERNVARFKDAPIRFHCTDVTRFAFPPSPLVLFGYNPFQAAIWRSVLDRIADRPYVVIYNNPLHAEIIDGHHVWFSDVTSRLENRRTVIFANFPPGS